MMRVNTRAGVSRFRGLSTSDLRQQATPRNVHGPARRTGSTCSRSWASAKTDLDDDVRVMGNVVDRVLAERRDDLEPTTGEAHLRYRLMSMGHDPLKG